LTDGKINFASMQAQESKTVKMAINDFVSHQQFFDQLVELIPAKYYRADEHEHVELRFLPTNAKAAVKQDFKKQARANKRKKLNPNGVEEGGGSSEDEGEEAQPGPGSAHTAANLGSSSSCSREELQARLHKKIEVSGGRASSLTRAQRVYPSTRAHTHTHTHTHEHTHTHAHTLFCMHMHTRTRMHAYVHTHTHTHAYTH